MDELKQRAGEKIEAFHEAAKTVADSSKTRVHDVYSQTADTIHKLRELFRSVWQHSLVRESRQRAAAWARDAARRLREGAPLLSPVTLYHDLRDLLHDRVWRRSMLIFVCGVVAGGMAGAACGARLAARAPPPGPHARALLAHPDHSVSLVEDAPATGAGAGEVVVRVQAFSVCGADRGALRGRGRALRALLGLQQRAVGRGFAGVVLDVGVGVDDLEMGDEVWGCVVEWCGGAACELLTIRRVCVGRRPAGLAAERAAGLPWGGTEALRALDDLRLTPDTAKGKRVAVCGAGRAAGCVALQALAAWGAAPTALAARPAAPALRALGAQDIVETGGEGGEGGEGGGPWEALQRRTVRGGPWDALVSCERLPHGAAATLLKARAPRWAVVSLVSPALVSDRLPAPLSTLFAVCFHSYRILRWCAGLGWHTDWLVPQWRARPALDRLAALVVAGDVAPVVDKVFLPQDFECALAHACSDDTVGATVIRFP